MNNIKKENIIIREAKLDDAKIIFELSNDLSVRKNSINKNKINWEEHVNWLRKKINSDNYLIYLFFSEGEFIGQVKFEIQNSEAIIGISIVREFRGKKLAVPLLQKGIKAILKSDKKINRIIAYIRPENKASENSFIKVGFSFYDRVEINNEKFNRFLFTREKNEYQE